jgi:hypothetical protein
MSQDLLDDIRGSMVLVTSKEWRVANDELFWSLREAVICLTAKNIQNLVTLSSPSCMDLTLSDRMSVCKG